MWDLGRAPPQIFIQCFRIINFSKLVNNLSQNFTIQKLQDENMLLGNQQLGKNKKLRLTLQARLDKKVEDNERRKWL